MEGLRVEQSEERLVGCVHRSIIPMRVEHPHHRVGMFEDNLLRTGEKFIVGPLRRAAHNKEREYEKCDGDHLRLKLMGMVYFTLTA